MRGGVGIMMSKINLKGSTYLIDTFDGFHEEEKYHKKITPYGVKKQDVIL